MTTEEKIWREEDNLDWEEIDHFINGSGTERCYEATDEDGRVWQKGVHDFDSDFNPILYVEQVT